MKKVCKYLVWTAFYIFVFVAVWLGFKVAGVFFGNPELGAIGVAFGITTDVLIANSENAKKRIGDFFGV